MVVILVAVEYLGDLIMSVRVLQGLNLGRRIHSECGWRQLTLWCLGLNNKAGEASELGVPAFLSLCFLSVPGVSSHVQLWASDGASSATSPSLP